MSQKKPEKLNSQQRPRVDTEFSALASLPASVEAEKMVLGSILLKEARYVETAQFLKDIDFSLDVNRRIFRRMGELHEHGEHIDRTTVANQLIRHDELQAVGGLTYLNSLDEGLPELPHIDSYIRIIQEKSRLRRLIFTAQKTIDACVHQQDESDTIIASAEKELSAIGLEGRQHDPILSPEAIMESFPGGFTAFIDPRRRPKGLNTGFLKLDDMTNGLHPGDLFILAARPSVGKTSLSLNIAHFVAHHGASVAFFSLEMSKESLLTRVICSTARVDSHRFRLGYLDQEARMRIQAAAAEIAGLPLWIDDKAPLTVMDVHARLRKIKAKHGLDLAVVDYLQLMASPGRAETRNIELGEMTRTLKLMAKELGIPILVLSQLSRAPELRRGDHRPILSDLRESGNLEQDADVVAFIYREEMYHSGREDLHGKAELLLSKQRNGPTGKIDLVFIHALTKFENRLMDMGEEPPE